MSLYAGNCSEHVCTLLIGYRSGGTPGFHTSSGRMTEIAGRRRGSSASSALATSRLFVLPVVARQWVSVDNRFLAAEASDSSVLGDVIWLGHSAFSRHIKVDVMLKTATKTFFPLPGRRSASSFELRPPTAMKTRRSLQELVCSNLLFF